MAQQKQWGNVTVRIQVGDITDIEIESFLFYAREDLKLDSGFGSAIATRGGVDIGKELKAMGTLPSTQAVITGAGALKASYIIHSNGPKFQEPDFESKLKRSMMNALTVAEQRGIKQIALPALGAGYYGLPAAESAKLMMSTLKEYISRGTSFTDIQIVLLDKRQYLPFEQAFLSNN